MLVVQELPSLSSTEEQVISSLKLKTKLESRSKESVKNLPRNFSENSSGLPTLNDILKSSIKEAATKLKKVEESMITHFIPTASEIAADFGGDTTKALAAAIAHITGHASAMNVKSLLCGKLLSFSLFS